MKTVIPKDMGSAGAGCYAHASGNFWHLSRCCLFMSAILWMCAGSVHGSWLWEEVGKIGGPGQRSHAVVVWTGQELLVWGGLPFGIDTKWKNDGWRYAPATDSWQAMSATNSPTARQFPVGLWTGSELVIWGGHKTTNPPTNWIKSILGKHPRLASVNTR